MNMLTEGRTWAEVNRQWPDHNAHRVDVRTVAYDTFRRVVEALFDLLVTVEVVEGATNSDKITPEGRYIVRTIYVDDESSEWLVLETPGAEQVEVPLSLVTKIVVL